MLDITQKWEICEFSFIQLREIYHLKGSHVHLLPHSHIPLVFPFSLFFLVSPPLLLLVSVRGLWGATLANSHHLRALFELSSRGRARWGSFLRAELGGCGSLKADPTGWDDQDLQCLRKHQSTPESKRGTPTKSSTPCCFRDTSSVAKCWCVSQTKCTKSVV